MVVFFLFLFFSLCVVYDHNAHTTKNTHKNYHNARITKTGVCYQIRIMVAHHSCTLPKLHLNPFWGKKEHNTCLRFLDFINVFFHLLSIFVQIKTQTQKHVSLKLLFCFYFFNFRKKDSYLYVYRYEFSGLSSDGILCHSIHTQKDGSWCEFACEYAN